MRYRYQPGGSINVAVETQRLKDLGYSDEQIMEIIGFEQPNALAEYMKNKRESMDVYMSPNFNPAVDYSNAIRGQLENAGYSEEDIEKIIGYDESTGIYTNPALERFSRSGDAPDSEYTDLASDLTSSTSSTDDLYNSLRQQGYTDLSAQKILKDEYGIGYQPGFRRRPEGTYFSPLLGSVGEAGQFLTDTYNRFFGRNQGSLSNFKRNTTSFDVTIDPNDPNKDNYVYDFDFLNQGKLPTKEEYGNYLRDNTFIDYNTKSGDYDLSFKRPGKSYFDETYEPRNRRNKVSLTDFTSGLSDRERAGFEGLGIMPEASTFEISDGATIFYEPGEDPRSKKDIRKTMMGQFEQPSTAQSSVLQPEDSGVMGPTLSEERYGGGLRFYQDGGRVSNVYDYMTEAESKDKTAANMRELNARFSPNFGNYTPSRPGGIITPDEQIFVSNWIRSINADGSIVEDPLTEEEEAEIRKAYKERLAAKGLDPIPSVESSVEPKVVIDTPEKEEKPKYEYKKPVRNYPGYEGPLDKDDFKGYGAGNIEWFTIDPFLRDKYGERYDEVVEFVKRRDAKRKEQNPLGLSSEKSSSHNVYMPVMELNPSSTQWDYNWKATHDDQGNLIQNDDYEPISYETATQLDLLEGININTGKPIRRNINTNEPFAGDLPRKDNNPIDKMVDFALDTGLGVLDAGMNTIKFVYHDVPNFIDRLIMDPEYSVGVDSWSEFGLNPFYGQDWKDVLYNIGHDVHPMSYIMGEEPLTRFTFDTDKAKRDFINRSGLFKDARDGAIDAMYFAVDQAENLKEINPTAYANLNPNNYIQKDITESMFKAGLDYNLGYVSNLLNDVVEGTESGINAITGGANDLFGLDIPDANFNRFDFGDPDALRRIPEFTGSTFEEAYAKADEVLNNGDVFLWNNDRYYIGKRITQEDKDSTLDMVLEEVPDNVTAEIFKSLYKGVEDGVITQDQMNNLVELYDKYHHPTIKINSHGDTYDRNLIAGYAASDILGKQLNRSNVNPFDNRMGIINIDARYLDDPQKIYSDIIAELGHTDQIYELGKFRLVANTIRDMVGAFGEDEFYPDDRIPFERYDSNADGVIDERDRETLNKAQSKLYDIEGTSEYDAHQNRERGVAAAAYNPYKINTDVLARPSEYGFNNLNDMNNLVENLNEVYFSNELMPEFGKGFQTIYNNDLNFNIRGNEGPDPTEQRVSSLSILLSEEHNFNKYVAPYLSKEVKDNLLNDNDRFRFLNTLFPNLKTSRYSSHTHAPGAHGAHEHRLGGSLYKAQNGTGNVLDDIEVVAYGPDMIQDAAGYNFQDEELILPMSNAVSTANPNFFPQSIPDLVSGFAPIEPDDTLIDRYFENQGMTLNQPKTIDDIQPVTEEQIFEEADQIQEPAFVPPMVDADGDGIPDYIDADAGTGESNYDQPQIDKKRKFGPALLDIYGDIGRTAVDAARIINPFMDKLEAREAERRVRRQTMADNAFDPSYADDRGITQRQTGKKFSETDRQYYYTNELAAKGLEVNEVDVDYPTLIKLMQMGAEIEIL